MGKKSGPAAPPPPDPVATAKAQASTNRETAITEANLNRINQITPGGSLEYRNIGNWPDGTPRYEQVTTLSPEQKVLYDQQNQIAQELGKTAQSSIGRVNNTLGQDFDFSGAAPRTLLTSRDGPDLQNNLGDLNFNETSRAAADSVYSQIASRLDPQFAQRENDTRDRLLNSGITENSEAYRREMGNLGRDRTDAYNTASNQSVLTGLAAQDQGFNQALAAGNFANDATTREFALDRDAEIDTATFNNGVRQRDIEESTYLRNLPLNDIAALLGASGGVQSPSFAPVPQVGVDGTDLIGATYNSYNAQYNEFQRQQQARSQGLGSIFGLAAQVGAAAVSDQRLKHNIKEIGKLVNGIKTYVFSYVGSASRHFGVMAQEVIKVKPEAVGQLPNGVYYVDYGKIGV